MTHWSHGVPNFDDIYIWANIQKLHVHLTLLKERGLKKQWVAEKVGISRGTLSLICSGKSEPTLRVALKIASLFGVSVEKLWGHLIEGESQPSE